MQYFITIFSKALFPSLGVLPLLALTLQSLWYRSPPKILPKLPVRLPAKFLPFPNPLPVYNHHNQQPPPQPTPHHSSPRHHNASRRVPGPYLHNRRFCPRCHPRCPRRQRPLCHDISLRRLRRQRLPHQGCPCRLPSLCWPCSLQGAHEAVSPISFP